MTFEQPANLNRYICPPLPFTWAFRWKLFKALLPILILSAFLLFQTVLLRQWATGQWEAWPYLAILGLLVFLVFATEIQMRLPWKYKRFLKLAEKKVHIGSGLAQYVRWEDITNWQFSNVPSDNRYRIATMEYKRGPKGEKFRRHSVVSEKLQIAQLIKGEKLRRHSIVLDKLQIEQLISEIKFRRQKDGFSFTTSDKEPDLPAAALESNPAPVAKNQASVYLYLAGYLLLIEGLPMLLAGLGVKDDSPDPDFTPKPNGSFAKLLIKHFHSGAQFRHFMLVAGATLCGTGGILIIWAILLGKKQKAAAQLWLAQQDQLKVPPAATTIR